jgi:hypothetical protein
MAFKGAIIRLIADFSTADERYRPVVVVHACNPHYSRGIAKRITNFHSVPGKVSKTLSQKQNKRAGGIAQVVECFSDLKPLI